MKTIDKYIGKNFIKSFLICLFAFEGIFIISQLFKVVRLISDGKFTTSEAGMYILTLVPRMTRYVCPIAVLLGALMTISIMASNLEIISLKTSGLSFKRIARMPIIIALIISFLMFIMYNTIYPMANKINEEIRNSKDIDDDIPETKENAFLRGQNGNYVYLFKEINRITGVGKIVEIIDLNENFDKSERIIIADNAKYNKNSKIWEFENVLIYNKNDNVPEKLEKFRDEKYTEEPNKFIIISHKARTLTIAELSTTVKETIGVGGDIKPYMYELGQRFSAPFASFIIVFIGLALGSRYVRGNSVINVGMSVALGYLYYTFNGYLEAYSKNGMINPFVAGWIPNLVFLGIGIYLMKKAEY